MNRLAFTLIELLISLSLMAFLLSTATYSFTQVKTMTARIQARQALHNTARIIYERLRFEIDSMHQGAAFYLRSGGATGPVELVFLHGKFDTVDFRIEDGYGMYVYHNTDQLWTRWAWIPDSRRIEVSSSTTVRKFQLTQDWVRNGINYKNQYFGFLPEPRRVAGAAVTELDANAFGTPSPYDYGDYTDLLRNSAPTALTCTDFRIEISLQDGTSISASTDTSSNHAINGVLIDGSADDARRPRLIRLRFDLTDDRLKMTETFSFTFLAPGLLPQ
jgi:prepilin-type N-terminal cleavage/methylation domain-containing protein